MGFKDIYKKALPFISTAVGMGGPLGNMALGMLNDKLGVTDVTSDNADQKLADYLKTNVEGMTELKKVEQDFAIKMKELGFQHENDLEKIAADDRANARQREIATHDSTPKIIAYIVVGATLGFEGFILFHGLKADLDQVIVGRILGTLDLALGLVLGYYYGSSASSRTKDETIHAAMTQD